jgi:hypothetical protein
MRDLASVPERGSPAAWDLTAPSTDPPAPNPSSARLTLENAK